MGAADDSTCVLAVVVGIGSVKIAVSVDISGAVVVATTGTEEVAATELVVAVTTTGAEDSVTSVSSGTVINDGMDESVITIIELLDTPANEVSVEILEDAVDKVKAVLIGVVVESESVASNPVLDLVTGKFSSTVVKVGRSTWVEVKESGGGGVVVTALVVVVVVTLVAIVVAVKALVVDVMATDDTGSLDSDVNTSDLVPALVS
ncbi:hypothetical protein GGI02_002505 [Coemansia sp. RSA 2322]|uniref:Uncharacterized protein n=1 Tax=Coemansia thaxteri TaxID=2663907 RepID=A0A9W8BAL3_9FUNG|nr:hypothetical protein H4R26_003764 [Coemansia thaxteri]KAJ2471090.1 hypothetical protein GGI02_002505 [Coemansia sp. RSA 2322]KAJ2481953.1 hypothetical protein EV174_003347 [Coemansia sp. RSA 2320]